jgi:hypothetical protein
MPNVPNFPGVPALSSYSTSGITLLVADLVSAITGIFGPPQWGVYLDGEQAIVANSTVDFSYKQDWVIADYPVEGGGFQSYDKVQLPFDSRIRFATGGSVTDRQALLNSVQDAANSLNLYDIYTPEAVYSSCNISHFDYDRAAMSGLGLLIIDVWFREIRVSSTATFSQTQSPTDSSQQSIGNVQAQTPSQSVDNSLAGGWQ